MCRSMSELFTRFLFRCTLTFLCSELNNRDTTLFTCKFCTCLANWLSLPIQNLSPGFSILGARILWRNGSWIGLSVPDGSEKSLHESKSLDLMLHMTVALKEALSDCSNRWDAVERPPSCLSRRVGQKFTDFLLRTATKSKRRLPTPRQLYATRGGEIQLAQLGSWQLRSSEQSVSNQSPSALAKVTHTGASPQFRFF